MRLNYFNSGVAVFTAASMLICFGLLTEASSGRAQPIVEAAGSCAGNAKAPAGPASAASAARQDPGAVIAIGVAGPREPCPSPFI